MIPFLGCLAVGETELTVQAFNQTGWGRQQWNVNAWGVEGEFANVDVTGIAMTAAVAAPQNTSPSALRPPFSLMFKAFGLVASGSCARVGLGVASCARGSNAQELAARIAQ